MIDFRKQPKNEPSLGKLQEFLDEALRLAEDLIQEADRLPPVEQDGSSPCAEAEEHYAKKEEKQETVQWYFKQLHTYLAIVRREIPKVEHDMTVISAQEERLHGNEARAHYSDAELELAAWYKRLQQDEQQILEVMQVVDTALARSTAKRFPGRIPQKWPGLLPPPVPTPIETMRRRLRQESPHEDVDDLLTSEDQRREPDVNRPPEYI